MTHFSGRQTESWRCVLVYGASANEPNGAALDLPSSNRRNFEPAARSRVWNKCGHARWGHAWTQQSQSTRDESASRVHDCFPSSRRGLRSPIWSGRRIPTRKFHRSTTCTCRRFRGRRSPDALVRKYLKTELRDAQLIPMDLPAGPDYVVGPGDGLSIDLWGGVTPADLPGG